MCVPLTSKRLPGFAMCHRENPVLAALIGAGVRLIQAHQSGTRQSPNLRSGSDARLFSICWTVVCRSAERQFVIVSTSSNTEGYLGSRFCLSFDGYLVGDYPRIAACLSRLRARR